MKEGMGFEPVSCIHGFIIWFKKVRFALHFDRWVWDSKPCYKNRGNISFNQPYQKEGMGFGT